AGQALQPHERRIPDGVFDGLIHGAHYAFKKFYCTANKNPASRAGLERISRWQLLLRLVRGRLVILCFLLVSGFIFLGFLLGGCFIGLGLLLGGRFIGLCLLLGGRFIGLRLLFVGRFHRLVFLGRRLVALRHRLVVLLAHLLVGLHRLVVLLGRGRCRRLGRRARNRHGLRLGRCGLRGGRGRDGRARLHILRPGRSRRCCCLRRCRRSGRRRRAGNADLTLELAELTLLDARHLHDVFGYLERAVLGAIVDDRLRLDRTDAG